MRVVEEIGKTVLSVLQRAPYARRIGSTKVAKGNRTTQVICCNLHALLLSRALGKILGVFVFCFLLFLLFV